MKPARCDTDEAILQIVESVAGVQEWWGEGVYPFGHINGNTTNGEVKAVE